MRPHNIQINAICPTIVMTDMGKTIWNDPKNEAITEVFLKKILVGCFGEADNVANIAYFFVSFE